jgi:hypothetical protein
MHSFSRKLFASSKSIRCLANYPTSTYKSTTGLVGLAVDFDARNTLLDLTSKCLQSVQVNFSTIIELIHFVVFLESTCRKWLQKEC